MRRAFLLVLDSVGIGGAPDAALFGDEGANTIGHIALACAQGNAEIPGLRTGRLKLPNMVRLGLGEAARLSTGQYPAGLEGGAEGLWGVGWERSVGKDTPSGHWEITGNPVMTKWHHFPDKVPTFPKELTTQIIEQAGLPGILGNCHGSGTVVIDEFGEEHIKTGKPIFYTSGDSVFQIAAHETSFGLQRLYDLCELVRRLVDPLNVGRVIARPFVGSSPGCFARTGNRRDYSMPPSEPTLLDQVVACGGRVIGMGKIGDIFARRGVSEVRKAHGNMPLFDLTLEVMEEARGGDLVFANFVDFDSEFGHRRDVAGYAAALEAFDRRLPEMLDRLCGGDLLIITADHGNDPTWRGTDHTREQVPILCCGPGAAVGCIGRRPFQDIGASIAAHLDLPAGSIEGSSFLNAAAASHHEAGDLAWSGL